MKVNGFMLIDWGPKYRSRGSDGDPKSVTVFTDRDTFREAFDSLDPKSVWEARGVPVVVGTTHTMEPYQEPEPAD